MTLTYDARGREAAPTTSTAPAQRRRNLFARILARIIAARQRQAMEEIRRYGIRLPHELEQAGWKLNERSEDSLPFIR